MEAVGSQNTSRSRGGVLRAPQGGVKSAQRALDILTLLTRREERLTFNEIGEALGLPRSSLHGLLTTMVRSGWLDYDRSSGTYWLGVCALEAGNVYLRSLDLSERARPIMEQIRDSLDETVQLSILDGRFAVYIAKVDGRQALTLASAVGRRLPAHATGIGKVLLAGLEREALDQLLRGVQLERFTENTITDLRRLHVALDAVRSRGYATDHEEYWIGVRCVAVPFRGQAGEVVAGMSVAAPAVRFTRPVQQRSLALLQGAAREFSEALGHRPVERSAGR